MEIALTIALCLRDDEAHLPVMVRDAVALATGLAEELETGEWTDSTRPERSREEAGGGDLVDVEDAELEGLELAELVRDAGPLPFEILALDERSRDNTLAALSILHAKVPQLRTISDLEPGTAIMRAARSAHGRVWLLLDGPFDGDHALWATRQVFCGDRAAMIPGELLAIRRNLGQATLGWLRGGLIGAQQEVERMLEAHGDRAAWSPPHKQGVRERASRFLRGRVGRLGLGHLDRPR
jgi:hypothetical protein